MNIKQAKKGVLILVGLMLMLGYNNCSGGPQAVDEASNSASGGGGGSATTTTIPPGPTGLCEADLMNLFARGYQPFLQTNCSLCHVNGPGKGQFAHSDINIAYNAFFQTGYVKVSNNAVSSSHQPPYSGPQHILAINDLKIEWQKGLTDYAACTGNPIAPPTVDPATIVQYETTQKASGVSATTTSKKLVWDLNTEILKINAAGAVPVLPGAKFELTVNYGKTAGGEIFYTFSQPRIYDATVDIHIKGLYVKINNRMLNYQTTFRFLDKNLYKNIPYGAAALISTGSLVSPGIVSPADQISVAFEALEVTTLPPQPPPVFVNFSGAKARYASSTAGFVDVDVILTAPTTESLIVTVEVPSDAGNCFSGVTTANVNTNLQTVGPANCFPDVKALVCPGTCSANTVLMGRAKSPVGTTYNRFDWDYLFTNATVIFAPGETSKTIRIALSKNIRKENDRLLSVRIAGVAGNVQVGTSDQLNIVISKLSNPAPTVGVATFAELMNAQTGILGQNCLKCHNSRDKAGGYDMSDYDEMVANRVLIPGDTANSKMYKRLNPNDPDSTLLKPMPLDGFMEQAYIREVEKWILDGAKNN